MASQLVTIEIETEVFFTEVGGESVPETVLVHTVCPIPVQAWAKVKAIEHIERMDTP